ncbi:GNAT family N-acetyltransferase [Paraclostridium ghonii]|uniref:RimJ/RimL family protein N-acetyltransferase n=1 Tax=Paraclostridium ghonii TaxID=29358 RepID=A0ABU0N2H9_9FIRM|nr:GNAT family N-acetyltransferase [Paeniclostridium ghonii]MDQ0557325.1 RimJ/RimL family protein N-acetyltransferase [Paeniclostridium ghonii]
MEDSIYPQMKIIETDKYILRPICIEDAMSMFEYYSQNKVVKYLPIKAHKSIAETKRFIRNYFIGSYKKGNVNHWAIVDKKNKKLIGNIGLNNVSRKDKEAEIGICINPMYWGDDIATQLTRYSLMYGFKVLNLEKLTATTYEQNPRTRKSLESLGFKYVKTYDKKIKNSNNTKVIKCDIYELYRKDYILSRYLD